MRPLRVAGLGLWMAVTASAFAMPADPELVEAGRRIYLEGRLPSGLPLRGLREGGASVQGQDAACVQCHRRSRMGGSEGQVTIPPLIAPALFGRFRTPGLRHPRQAAGVEFQDFPHRSRRPYDDVSLTNAVRDGVDTEGHAFVYLMPRYALDDAAMAALLAYLHALDAGPSEGVEQGVVHLSNVVSADAETAKSQSYLRVLRACIADKSARIRSADGTATLAWHLHEWSLHGPAETWSAQLDDAYLTPHPPCRQCGRFGQCGRPRSRPHAGERLRRPRRLGSWPQAWPAPGALRRIVGSCAPGQAGRKWRMRLKPCGKTCCCDQDSQFAGQLHLKSGGPAERTDLMATGKT